MQPFSLLILCENIFFITFTCLQIGLVLSSVFSQFDGILQKKLRFYIDDTQNTITSLFTYICNTNVVFPAEP